jgi:hypothetical protein
MPNYLEKVQISKSEPKKCSFLCTFNPMPESTLSSSQGLWIWPHIVGERRGKRAIFTSYFRDYNTDLWICSVPKSWPFLHRPRHPSTQRRPFYIKLAGDALNTTYSIFSVVLCTAFWEFWRNLPHISAALRTNLKSGTWPFFKGRTTPYRLDFVAWLFWCLFAVYLAH